MGLIKAAKDAIGSTLKDQWKEAIRCEDMTNEILMMKKTTETGVITNKSIIVVGPGQCAVIYDNGRVLDATAEEGMYTFDTSSSPSFFGGQFGEVFKEMWERFTYGGATAKQQAVFFFNIKEIIDNKFGTKEPIAFQDWSHAIPNQMTNTLIPMTVNIRCFGTYTFRIINPALFMSKIAGTADVYRKSQLQEQMRTEIMAVFQNVANELGDEQHKVPVIQMPSQTDEIREMMDEKVFDEPIRARGIEIVCFAVESVSLDDESKEKIEKYELSSNAYLQQGKMVEAYANAVQDAAKNANGPGAGFMGIGVMNMASNGMVGSVANNPWNSQNMENSTIDMSKEQALKQETEEIKTETVIAATTSTENMKKQEITMQEGEWKCECGNVNDPDAKFCDECGKKRTVKKVCPNCNMENDDDAKFCRRCGEKF